MYSHVTCVAYTSSGDMHTIIMQHTVTAAAVVPATPNAIPPLRATSSLLCGGSGEVGTGVVDSKNEKFQQ